MTSNHDLIWILDNDPACVSLYQQTLGLQYHIRLLSSVEQLTNALAKMGTEGPRLLIADPESAKSGLKEMLGSSKDSNSNRKPEFIIATKLDDLELIRCYLRKGARDYILKPLRPNELVAKVERALHQISNREILILRNDLDGILINDLTFREHQLLTMFLSRPTRSVTRDELYSALWSKVTVNRKTLDVHIFNLRRKLQPYGYGIACQDQIFSLQKNDKSTRPS